jgi:prepilin-type N-terminal cleavage/methylation domain-containing protein
MNSATHARRSSRGFTLIELMMVVTIIGILASVAIPSFSKLTLRAKTSERSAVMLRIKSAITDYYSRNGALLIVPGSAVGATVTTTGSWNPPWPPDPTRRPILNNQVGWKEYFTGSNGNGAINGEIEGRLYYSYTFFVTDGPAWSEYYVEAAGDLDGDSRYSYKIMRWYKQNGIFQPYNVYADPQGLLTNESPSAGFEDDVSTYQTF